MPGGDIAPAILTRSLRTARQRIRELRSLTPKLHLDLMDGQFVRQRSIGPTQVARLRMPPGSTAHLMVKETSPWIAACAQAGIRRIVLHVEIELSPQRIRLLRKHFDVLLAINPGTSISRLRPYWRFISGVQVMTVHPGKQGSRFLPRQIKVVRHLHRTHPRLRLSVDGGINPKTLVAAAMAGAKEFIVGSYITHGQIPRLQFQRLKYADRLLART